MEGQSALPRVEALLHLEHSKRCLGGWRYESHLGKETNLRGLNLILGELLKIYSPHQAFKILYAGEIVQAVWVILQSIKHFSKPFSTSVQ